MSTETEKRISDKEAREYYTSLGATNLNDWVWYNPFIPAIGREDEIEQLTKILQRKDNACVMVTGQSGCGKTNLVRTIAHIIRKNNIKTLENYTVIEVPTGLINTESVSGKLEKKLSEFIEHAHKSRIILVMEHAETLIGQGATNTSNVDVAQLLIPYLDKIKIIFTTTDNQYQFGFSNLPSFTRKVTQVKLVEMNDENTIEIIKKNHCSITRDYNVHFHNESFSELVDLSRKIRNRANPDKCLSLMKEVANRYHKDEGRTVYIKNNHLIETISAKTGIQFIENPEYRERVKELPFEIKKDIFGQDEAVDEICSHIMMKDFRSKERANLPIVFFLTGPTGTGKTYMAKTLAKHLLNDDKKMFRVDMAELTDYFKIDALLGKQYGSTKNTAFVNFVDSNPGGILLLDEFEKADWHIKNLFLSAFAEAELSDAKGKKLYFSDMIIILTSNAVIKKTNDIGFNGNENNDMHREELTRYFPAELVNRMDAVLFFEPLNKESCYNIVSKMMTETIENFKKKGINLNVSEDITEFIVDEGYSVKFNARELSRAFESNLLKRLVKFFFSTENCSSEWYAVMTENKINILTKDQSQIKDNEVAA